MRALILTIPKPDLTDIKPLFDILPDPCKAIICLEPDDAITDLVKDHMDKEWILRGTLLWRSSKIQCMRLEIQTELDFPILVPRSLHCVVSFDSSILSNPSLYARSIEKNTQPHHLSFAAINKGMVGRLAFWDMWDISNNKKANKNATA